VTLSFADFAANLTYDALPPEVLQVLRRSFTDTIGVAAIGSTTEMSEAAHKGAAAMFGVSTSGTARTLMRGTKLSPAGAAMAGAFTIDSVDAHDGTSPCKGHAGSAIFPALMAVADAENSLGRLMDGKTFAMLLALAYEVSYRAGLAQHATCTDYHTSGAWTAVGVAAAVARQLGGNKEMIRHAAGIGEYHGPRSQMMRCIDFPTMLRDGVGWGAPTGVTAAYLAQAGFTGSPALTCEGEAESPFWSDLGSAWRLVEDTHYKPYPCCRWAHPSVDSVADLMQEHGLHHSQVASIEIKTFHNATRLAGHAPQSLDEFAYGIAFPVATMVVRGQIGATELTRETLQDPDIKRISQATTLVDDPYYTKISVGKRWAEVSMTLTDGRVVKADPRTPRGDTDLPLSDQEISDKFHLFADPVLGAASAREIESLTGNFDQLSANDFKHLMLKCTQGKPQ